MNQKDYKEIARIIKEEKDLLQTYSYSSRPDSDGSRMNRKIAERLADYFEREENRSKRIMGEKGFIRNKIVNKEEDKNGRF